MQQDAISISSVWLLLSIAAVIAANSAETTCPASPRVEVSTAIAPAAGAYPVWVVDGSFGRWQGAEGLVKTVWILARDHPGELHVVGSRLDGDGRVQFALPGGTALADELTIADADAQQMIPGGIDPDALRRYSFRSSVVVYPSAGCWELRVRYGRSESRIVVELNEES